MVSQAGSKPDPRVGEHLRARRKQSGLTLSALADLVGVSPATLSQIENGHTRVTDERIRALSQHIAPTSPFSTSPSRQLCTKRPTSPTGVPMNLYH